jgi:hypothetical protein
MSTKVEMEIQERTVVERELNLLMELTLRMESELMTALNNARN